MKKVTDERIIFENLKHIKTAFLVQTLGIIAILVIDGIQNGYQHAHNNPLWMLVLITTIVLSYSRLRTAVEMEKPRRKSRSSSYVNASIAPLAAGLAVFSLALFARSSMMNAFILGVVLFTAYLIPALLITYYRKKNQDEDDM
ncbi:hypothetical protein [Paenibacillus sp.]|jgi:hypothetical protein|uniref:hypothetical protein n=1 Tax=Paenibacillus sp. TaxID=58172 RepID=UPI002823DCE0|nr:hypothetical protein [Paenibacillus sp.]MDR0268239.1 hypothetical protein [Paenibacillus sp.]